MSQKVQTSYEENWFWIKLLPLIPKLAYLVDLKEIEKKL